MGIGARDIGPAGGVARPILQRLQRGGALSPELLTRIQQLCGRFESVPARALLQGENDPVRRPRHIVSGWACRWRMLSDGRRQIFDFVLPGEGVCVHLRPTPAARCSTTALTAVRLTDAGELLRAETLAAYPELVALLQAQADEEERRLLDQVVRLGRLTALERLAHLLLDLAGRLGAVGQADGDRFALPVTQEVLGDALGLSVVHVNRTIQELRRQDLVVIERGLVRLLNVPTLRALADFR